MVSTHKKRGSLTVEASIVLPIVLITLLFFINFINVYLEHMCMQQALNNTAKKISQNAYLVYRFSGEEQYTEYINNINSQEYDDSVLIEKANTVIDGYNTVEDNFKTTIDSVSDFAESIKNIAFSSILTDFGAFWNSCMNVIGKTVELFNNVVNTQKSTKLLIKYIGDLGKKNSKYIILQTLYKELEGQANSMFVTHLFLKYTRDLKVSVKRLENVKLASTKLDDDKNGTFKLLLTYTFKNPFSLLNSKSMEYSIINREIRMFHTATVSPFVGKSGTSLKELHDKKFNRIDGLGGSTSETGGTGYSGGGEEGSGTR